MAVKSLELVPWKPFPAITENHEQTEVFRRRFEVLDYYSQINTLYETSLNSRSCFASRTYDEIMIPHMYDSVHLFCLFKQYPYLHQCCQKREPQVAGISLWPKPQPSHTQSLMA